MIEIAEIGVVDGWVHEDLVRQKTFTAEVAIYLGGDRLSCCDEAAIARIEGEIVGAATISPQGERYDGEATIVGLFVLPSFRRSGIGAALLGAAVVRCRERGLTPVRIDAISRGGMACHNRLPEELAGLVNCHQYVRHI